MPLPARGRGLKRYETVLVNSDAASPPARGRGLKPYECLRQEIRICRPPRGGAGMNRQAGPLTLSLADVPRSRGDEPPDEAGTFWRGVHLSVEEQASYIQGSVHTWAAFSSSSRRKEKAFHRNSLFRINNQGQARQGHQGVFAYPHRGRGAVQGRNEGAGDTPGAGTGRQAPLRRGGDR